MRRILTVLAPTVAISLALAAPGAAFAHGARHHKRHHHATGAHVIKLTPVQAGKETTGAPAAENIGTVASYEKEVLTIKLTDGTLMSGKVTPQTRLICVTPSPSTASGSGFDGGHFGWWHHGGSCAEPSSEPGSTEPGTGSSQSPSTQDSQGSDSQGADSQGWNDRSDCFQGKEVDLEKVLVPGATVGEAELALTPAGAIWNLVVIDQ